MSMLNLGILAAISPGSFQSTAPYPFANPQGLIADTAYRALLATMPDIALFEKSFQVQRAYGQKPHDRFELKYRTDLPVSPEWHAFVAELEGPQYCAAIARLLGTRRFSMRFQWQYSFHGCSVSPHCDSENKLGSHIFYFNTPTDWKEEWGGETLVLDDGSALDCRSAPELSAFRIVQASETIGNRSFLFMRTAHSWHAVNELTSPEGVMRKIFTIVFERKLSFFQKIVLRARRVVSGA